MPFTAIKALYLKLKSRLEKDDPLPPSSLEPQKSPITKDSVSETDLLYGLIGNIMGTMLDVGAHRGTSTMPFALGKWEVFAFEPDIDNRTVLEKRFKDFPNVHIESRAVGDKNQSGVEFYSSEVSSGISALSKFHESHRLKGYVDTMTLQNYCKQKNITRVDLLKIDTEGFDLFVLKGFPWERISPTVIECEFEDRKTIPLGYRYEDIADYLVQKGYRLIISEWYPVVEYGVKHKWRCFARYPYQLQDENAWGNIIAFKYRKDLKRLCKQIKKSGVKIA